MPTMRMRLAAPALLVALALTGAGCGGGGSKAKPGAGGVPSSASVIPASVPAFVAVNIDLESDQLKRADALAKKFPGRAKALAQIRAELTKNGVDFERDVKPALGPEVGIAWLDFADNGNNVVGVIQPKDEAKFAALVEKANKSDPKNPALTAKIGDWTAVADSQAKLDRLESAQNGAKLADDDRFKAALGDLPADALVKAYVNGLAVRQAVKTLPAFAGTGSVLSGTALQQLEWISAAATAESNGLRFAAGAKAGKGGGTYTSELVDALPAGAWTAVSFNNLAASLRKALDALSSTPGFESKRTQLEQALGFSVENDLLPLFAGEGALAVYPGPAGTSVPTVDFVLKVKDEAKARRVLERLTALARLGSIGTVRTVDVGGVTATELSPTGTNVAVYYGVSKGLIIATNSRSGLSSVGGSGQKLADDPLFKAARSGAEAPDETNGFFYFNLHAAVPALINLVGSLAPSQGLLDARANAEALQSFFLYSTRDGDVIRAAGFLGVK
jgi:uncharacterized protein DUF3352